MRPDRSSSTPPDPARGIYPRWVLALIGIAAVLHLNYWLWDDDRLVLGLPVNLFYHVALTLLVSGLMLLLVRTA